MLYHLRFLELVFPPIEGREEGYVRDPWFLDSGSSDEAMLYNRMQDMNKIHELKGSPQSGSLVPLEMHYPG